jgi:chlorite dismutase
MPEQTLRTLNHFSLFTFTDAYWMLNQSAKASFHEHWLDGLGTAATNFDFYQNTDSRAELLVWCALNASESCAASDYFEKFALVTTPLRHLIRPVDSLWGFTGPAPDAQAPSAWEIDPLATTRLRYLVMVPFTRTPEWYLMGRESRQGVRIEHVDMGKEVEGIRQLVLYSFGLQEQASVGVYEMDDLLPFSDLMQEQQRDTGAGPFALKEVPVYTAIYHPAAETLALWK